MPREPHHVPHRPLVPLLAHRHARSGWRVLLALLLVAITTLALLPAPPQTVDLGWDKLNHFAAFGTLSAVTALAWTGWWHWGRNLLAMLAYGVLIEVLQSFTPTRSADWHDVVADLAGALLGLLLVRLLWSRLAPARHTP